MAIPLRYESPRRQGSPRPFRRGCATNDGRTAASWPAASIAVTPAMRERLCQSASPSEEIFDQLDESNADCHLSRISVTATTTRSTSRLHAYRDDTRWAILVELVGYNPRAFGVIDVIHHFGNCLDGGAGFENDDFLDRGSPTADFRWTRDQALVPHGAGCRG